MKHGDFGCFYLSENLDELVDSKQPAKKTDWEDYLYELPQSLPDALHQHSGKQRCLFSNYIIELHFWCCSYFDCYFGFVFH